ncbi:transcriptional regulator MvaT [Litchfieldella qijiaojingensis]|uniref:Transcriptional regulator MvaT n=1 Tax=Litchfieldella qijiaojingensis TaxID=980347 RepID=A0ABQ2ZBB0_9GAMM|nr:histone-like nucleoid-structuring protein, MvaT/MvaU family [Halomonas qijiaojingensis]GGY09547.1 transcriptional regulator MvaT [Halomonas qijiaojingensis]
MSLLNEYLQQEQQLKELNEKLEKLQNDPRLKAELEFKEKLETLMKDFNKSAADVMELLSPKPAGKAAAASAATTAGGRRKRKLKIYKNPNTGEVVETRGGNQKTLKAWKDEYGTDIVESWLVRVES